MSIMLPPTTTSFESNLSIPTTDFALIESQKENIRPLASGRSAATLSTLSDKETSEAVIAQGHEQYKRLVEEAEKRDREGEDMEDGITDLLDAYYKHVTWAMQHNSSSNNYVLPLIEATTRRFTADNRFAQDVRYLKMWIMYTRMVERREEIWAYLESRNIGTNHALFYEEWAAANEALGRKKKTDDIYQLGIARRAAPVDRLKSRYQAFLQRILVTSSRDIPDDEPLVPSRSGGRSILGQVAAGPSSISGATQLAPSTRLSRAPNGAKMAIFSDDGGKKSQDGGPAEWGDLGTRDDRRKENVMEATAWKGETMPQKGAAPRTPKPEVFRDMGANRDIVRSAEEALFKPKQLTDAELLRADPLRHYGDISGTSQPVPSLPAPPSTRKAPRPKSAAHVLQPWVCPSDGALIKDSKGKPERRMFDWDAVYKGGEEWSFEEVKARQRGLLGREYRGDVKEWEMGWHLPGSSTPKAAPRPKKMPSPTVNTKLANEEIMAMFDQTIHRGKARDESDSDSDSEDEDDEDAMPVESAPTPLPPRAGPSMLAAYSVPIPPTPTPAQGHSALNRPAAPMIFQDENAIPASVSRPARVNVFDQTPAKTPARAPLSVQKPRAFEVFPEEDQAQEEQPAESVLPPRANIFSTPAYKPAARRIIVSNAITEEEDEGEGDQYVPLNNDGQADDQENVGYGYGTEEGQNPISKYKNYLSFMTPISERTNEHTQMTNLRSSQSTNVFSVSSGRRSSVRSVYQDGEDLVAEDLPPSNLSAVQEEEERSASRPSESFDESVGFPRNEDDVSFPQQLEESGSDAARFVLPEGFTIHNRPAENQHHSMVVTDARPDTPREASPEPELEAEPEPEAESDTAAFVTANHGMLEVMTTTATLPNPCIPTDDEVLATLIRDIKPPLSELPNFLDLRNTTSNRLASLNSHTKVKPRRSSAAPRPSVSADDCVGITLGDREFEVSNKIGEGGFGAVFLAVDVRLRQQMDDADSDDEDEDDEVDRSLVAVKVEKPGSVWEAVILDRILTRLDPVHRPSIIRPRELISFADESYLVLDYAPQGTLLDAVNKASTMGIAPATAGGPSALDELVAIFFTIELLRLIESLHRSQFIHGDMKIDNCLVRLEDIPSSEGGASSWSTQYSPLGSNGWQHKGIKLIDFGRAIDMSLFPAGEKQKFKADWKVDERDCVEMREDREWSYETDYFGLASICYCMLFGKYITTEEGVTPEGKSGKWYKITTPLKRYWQQPLWSKLFDTLLNPNIVEGELPINDSLRDIRGEFEVYLEENCQKGGKSLKSMLKKIELAAITARR